MLADTGRFEVYAPTMPGHNGGIKARWFLDTKELADDVERRMDALGWRTAHIVGNSLGGWAAWEFTARYPEQVDRLVLLAAAGFLAAAASFLAGIGLPSLAPNCARNAPGFLIAF